MKSRVKIRLSFTLIFPDGVDPLLFSDADINNMIAYGVEPYCRAKKFDLKKHPLDIEKGARLDIRFPRPRK